jgi:hypothetical protein
MYGDIGIGKLGQAGKEVTPWLLRNGHDHIGGTRPINGLVEAVDPPKDGNGVRSRVHRQMAPSKPRLGKLVVAGIHESHDRYSWRGRSLQVMQ